MHSTFSRPIALILLILLPLLGGCVAAVTAGAIATGSSVHDRRGFGTVVDDKRIQLGAYDEINRDKELVLKNRVMIAVYNGVMLLMGEVRGERPISNRVQSKPSLDSRACVASSTRSM